MEKYHNRWKDYARESYFDLHGPYSQGYYTARIEFLAPVQGGDPRGWAVYMGPNKTQLHGENYFFSTREAAKAEVEFHYELDCAL